MFSKPIKFFKEVKAQLLKVSWPTKSELIGATKVVIFITFLITIFIGIVDFSFSQFLSWIFS